MIKKPICLRIICTVFVTSNILLFSKAYISYELSGGRFGDNLLAYAHAKWLSYKKNMPLIYKPFEYSNQLVLDAAESSRINPSLSTTATPTLVTKNRPLSLSHKKRKKRQRKTKVLNRNRNNNPPLVLPKYCRVTLSKNNMNIDPDTDTIYIVPYFSETFSEHYINPKWIYFPVNWDDIGFKNKLKKLICPKNLISSIKLPTEKVSVAIHLRRGGGVDSPLADDDQDYAKKGICADLQDPLKFPPLYFYIDQIQRIYELLNHGSLYIHIFTDDPSPETLVHKISHKFSHLHNIQFDYRKEGNAHNKNVLEDFFALTQFDCIIRPQSNFSIMAAKIADYVIEISPIKAHIVKDEIYIDQTEIKIRDIKQCKKDLLNINKIKSSLAKFKNFFLINFDKY